MGLCKWEVSGYISEMKCWSLQCFVLFCFLLFPSACVYVCVLGPSGTEGLDLLKGTGLRWTGRKCSAVPPPLPASYILSSEVVDMGLAYESLWFFEISEFSRCQITPTLNFMDLPHLHPVSEY